MAKAILDGKLQLETGSQKKLHLQHYTSGAAEDTAANNLLGSFHLFSFVGLSETQFCRADLPLFRLRLQNQTFPCLLLLNPTTARLTPSAASATGKPTLANVAEQLSQGSDVAIQHCVGIFMPEEEPLP